MDPNAFAFWGLSIAPSILVALHACIDDLKNHNSLEGWTELEISGQIYFDATIDSHQEKKSRIVCNASRYILHQEIFLMLMSFVIALCAALIQFYLKDEELSKTLKTTFGVILFSFLTLIVICFYKYMQYFQMDSRKFFSKYKNSPKKLYWDKVMVVGIATFLSTGLSFTLTLIIECSGK